MNTLFDTPEKYDLHPPETWTVVREAVGRATYYRVFIGNGSGWVDSFPARADAQRVIDSPSSWLRKRYEKEKAARLTSERAAVLA